MSWYLFLIFSIFAMIFFIFGYTYKTRLYVILGSLFMIFIGFLTVTNGLYLPNGYNIDYDSFQINKIELDANTTTSTIIISNPQLIPNYEHIDKDNVYSKWLFGLLFIFVGAFVLFDAFFNNRFTKFV